MTHVHVKFNHDYESCDLFYHNVCICNLYLVSIHWGMGGRGEGEGERPRELSDFRCTMYMYTCLWSSVGEWTSLLPSLGSTCMYIYVSCTCILTGSLKTLHIVLLVSWTRPLPPQRWMYCITSTRGNTSSAMEGVVWFTRLTVLHAVYYPRMDEQEPGKIMGGGGGWYITCTCNFVLILHSGLDRNTGEGSSHSGG